MARLKKLNKDITPTNYRLCDPVHISGSQRDSDDEPFRGFGRREKAHLVERVERQRQRHSRRRHHLHHRPAGPKKQVHRVS